VQHQFEDVYWERKEDWSYAEAALRGSSYLKLPKLLQFVTGNIGLHHVHHLSARIPNYNLQRAHDENPVFHDVPRLTFWDGIRAPDPMFRGSHPRESGRVAPRSPGEGGKAGAIAMSCPLGRQSTCSPRSGLL